MTTKKLLFATCLAAFGLSCLDAGKASAQSPASGEKEEPLQMLIDHGQGKQKHRESHHGVMEPVGLAAGQQVGITLQFPRKRAGSVVMVSPLDGGQVDPRGPVAISSDGTVAFKFQPDRTPGLYRLVIEGAQQYQLSLYAFDPDRPARPSRGH